MWSPQQARALDAVGRWMRSGADRVFRLFGAAGTGKTHLAAAIAEMAHVPVIFAAPTAKAAMMLSRRGCPAQTIHSLIYRVTPRSRARLDALVDRLAVTDPVSPEYESMLADIAEEEHILAQPLFSLVGRDFDDDTIIIVDECSMVDQTVGGDLMSHGCRVIAIGDPYQLPPVRGEGYFCDGTQPDAMLDEIHRQAADSPIIAMATAVRSGDSLPIGDYGCGCAVIPRSSDFRDRALESSQIITGRNRTRRACNRRIRELRGLTGAVAVSDRVVCLRNDPDLGIRNGQIWTVMDVSFSGGLADITMDDAADGMHTVQAHLDHFTGMTPLAYSRGNGVAELDHGWAITTHKAQGSQWSDVLVIDESAAFGPQASRWLYTAITRAQHSVAVVRG